MATISGLILNIDEDDNLLLMINGEETITNTSGLNVTYLDDGYEDSSDEDYSSDEEEEEEEELNEEDMVKTAKKSIKACRRCKLPSNMRGRRSKR